VDVVRGVFHQQRGVLQQVDPQGVQHVCLLLRVQDLPASKAGQTLLLI
jgi:hypothetical protein